MVATTFPPPEAQNVDVLLSGLVGNPNHNLDQVGVRVVDRAEATPEGVRSGSLST